ncbi:class I SAM-dependent methyltransferase [Leptolyngbyaceae cyanobacterium CCMR0082]|uniref:Class I SAM-dependent methyltransferase n=1 Tax=Adonisia turfae CCMR0082 TaxID=2304604 RepID=A0A6M0RZ52_9CYAN|nr:class I SAM-dependent methyltransferase [Adonisia turfae]NEZ61436.1 class I SAM-dependent methyltransferase [Adonisia turfae CCMR0082]
MKFSLFVQLQKQLIAWGMAKATAGDLHAIKVTGCEHHTNLGDLKQALLGNLGGTVLEIGPGTGANLSYYSPSIHWLGVEPNRFMHPYLHGEAKRQGLQQIKIHEGIAEHLPAESNTIDTVVSTHVLCSVTHLGQAIQEIKRVLKPGGTFIFLEHVAAKPDTWARHLQESITPAWKTLFDNCHPNREIWKALDEAGFVPMDYEHFQIPFPIVGDHIVGVATKQLSYKKDIEMTPSLS